MLIGVVGNCDVAGRGEARRGGVTSFGYTFEARTLRRWNGSSSSSCSVAVKSSPHLRRCPRNTSHAAHAPFRATSGSVPLPGWCRATHKSLPADISICHLLTVILACTNGGWLPLRSEQLPARRRIIVAYDCRAAKLHYPRPPCTSIVLLDRGVPIRPPNDRVLEARWPTGCSRRSSHPMSSPRRRYR